MSDDTTLSSISSDLPAPPLGILWNVPSLPNPLIERPDLLAALRERLLQTSADGQGRSPHVAIQGEDGLGKTVLALTLAHSLPIRAHFPDGIYWLSYGPEPDRFSLLGELIQVFDPTFQLSTLRAASIHLHTLLLDKRALLILDDAWERQLLQRLFPVGEQCRVLVTTRHRHLAQRIDPAFHELEPLPAAQTLELCETFSAREMDVTERAQALKLARRAGARPLALRLLAADVRAGRAWQELTDNLQAEITRLEALPARERLLQDDIALEAVALCCLRALEESYPQIRERFAWFGVLGREGVITPLLMATVWQMVESEAEALLALLENAGLLARAAPISCAARVYAAYRIHPLLHVCACLLLSKPIPEGAGVSTQEAHRLLLERYRNRDTDLPGAPFSWANLADDGYIHRYLIRHLKEAGLSEEAERLLRAETSEGRNAWFMTRERLGQRGGYIEDVQLLLRGVKMQSLRAANRGESIPTLGREARYSLILASFNSMATALPGSLITRLVQYGIWSPMAGLAYLRQLPEAEERLETLQELALSLWHAQHLLALPIAREMERAGLRIPGPRPVVYYDERILLREEARVQIAAAEEQADAEERRRMLLEALDCARQILEPESLDEMRRQIALALGDAGFSEQALAVARTIDSANLRSHFYTDFAVSLAAKGRREQALKVARKISVSAARTLALVALVEYWTVEEGRAVRLHELQAASRRERSADWRAHILTQIAGKMPTTAERGEAAREAAKVALELKAGPERDELLNKICPLLLAVEDWEEIDALVPAIYNGYHQAQVQRAFVLALAEAGRVEEALVQVQEIQHAGEQPKVLVDLACYLTREQLPEALLIARTMFMYASRGAALFGLVRHLESEQEAEAVWEEALAYAHEAGPLIAYCYPKEETPLRLAEGGRLEQALMEARAISNPQDRMLALQNIAPFVKEEETNEAIWAEAVKAARRIEHPNLRNQLQGWLAVALAETGRIAMARSVILEIEHADDRAEAFMGIARQLPDPEERNAALEEALTAIPQFPLSDIMVDFFPKLAGLLNEDLLQKAILVTRRIAEREASAEILVCIGEQLQRVSEERFYPLWNMLMQESLTLTRPQLQALLTALAPSLLKYGGLESVEEVLTAAQDVARWWP